MNRGHMILVQDRDNSLLQAKLIGKDKIKVIDSAYFYIGDMKIVMPGKQSWFYWTYRLYI